MPDKQTIEKARADKRAGKSASTQAGEFVRAEIDKIRQGEQYFALLRVRSLVRPFLGGGRSIAFSSIIRPQFHVPLRCFRPPGAPSW